MKYDITIIIVAYRSQQMIDVCLESIIKHTKFCTYEIIIVDNDANHPHRYILKEKYISSRITIVSNTENIGFSRANNQAIKKSKGNTILLINPDTELISDAISNCYTRLINSCNAACGTQLVFPDGNFQMSGWHYTFMNIGHLIKIPYMKYFYDKIRKVQAIHEIKSDNGQKVDWINGAFLMVKKEIVMKAGLMDEEFFLYSEEPEWCYRLGKYGNLVIYNNDKVIHKVGGITDKQYKSDGKGYFYLFDKRGLQMIVSEFLRIKKQYGKLLLIVYYLIFLFSLPVVSIILMLSKLFPSLKHLYTEKEIIGYSKNIIKSTGYVKKMLGNKKYFYKIMD